MQIRTLFNLWLPLAVSFELMMLEGPAVQGAMGRLSKPDLNLAAFGLMLQLSLLIESPVIMLLATAIALVKDPESYRAVRRFTINLAVFCTALTALVAFTPLFDLVASTIMHVPQKIVEAARIPMRIMLLWSAAIAWRRSYQGILVGCGQTRMVSWGTAIRLIAAVTTATLLARWGGLPGAAVGACALMAAVITEACATTAFALPVVKRDVLQRPDDHRILSQRDIFSFHAPLMATTLLTLLAQPMTSAALARLASPERTLAAGPVAFMLLLVMRGWGLALQEITVAYSHRPDSRATLKRFAWLVGGATSAATAIIVFTPLLDLYLRNVIHLRPYLFGYVRIGVAVGIALPLITALGSWARGILVAATRTNIVYRGMGINLATHAVLLTAGVIMRLPGMLAASSAFTLAAIVEFAYLSRCAVAVPAFEPLPGLAHIPEDNLLAAVTD